MFCINTVNDMLSPLCEIWRPQLLSIGRISSTHSWWKVYDCTFWIFIIGSFNSCRTLNSLLCLIMCWTGSGYITHLECGEAVAVWPQYRALCIKCQSSLWSSSLCEGLRLNPLNNLSQPWWRQKLHFNMATAPHSSVPHLFCIFIVTNFNVIYKSAAFQ